VVCTLAGEELSVTVPQFARIEKTLRASGYDVADRCLQRVRNAAGNSSN
jgi:hypothetical protein